MSICSIFVSTRRFAVLLSTVLVALAMSGCYNHPVRHLTSDVALIKAGATTRQEAITLLGEPDSMRKLTDGTEEWAYHEEDKSTWQQVPVMGRAFSSNGYKTISLILKGDTVAAVHYGDYDKHEFDWRDDYTWQKIDQKGGTEAETQTETKTGK